VYTGFGEAIRRYIDGAPAAEGDYTFPTVHDGLRGMLFIETAVESAKAGSAWLKLE
jgi:hypothetical protein